jgi:hypothetical protein
MTTTTQGHTPGPWFSASYVVGSDKGTIANAYNPRLGDEGEANARLIAAAPEMLEALRRLTFAAASRDNTMGDPCRLLECKAELAAATREAQAIIARATNA